MDNSKDSVKLVKPQLCIYGEEYAIINKLDTTVQVKSEMKLIQPCYKKINNDDTDTDDDSDNINENDKPQIVDDSIENALPTITKRYYVTYTLDINKILPINNILKK